MVKRKDNHGLSGTARGHASRLGKENTGVILSLFIELV